MHTIIKKEKQPSIDVQSCSENIQQIYRRTLLQKCDFNNFAAASKKAKRQLVILKRCQSKMVASINIFYFECICQV